MRLARTFLVVCFLGMLVLSCGTSTVGPARAVFPIPRTRALDMELTLSEAQGSPDHPITIQASIRNAGTAPVAVLQGGGLCGGIQIEIHDEHGAQVTMDDPCAPVPVPLCDVPRFDPGESQSVSRTFTGDTYQRVEGPPLACALVAAPSGTYTATVSCNVYWMIDGAPETLKRTASFHWTSP